MAAPSQSSTTRPDLSGVRVTLLTPQGRGAVASLSVMGVEAAGAVAEYFQPAGKFMAPDMPVGRICYGRWGSEAAEDVVVCRLADSAFEVHCHGGSQAATRIIEDLTSLGCQAREWSDESIPLNGRTDAISSAAERAIAAATTERTASILLDQYQGSLGRELERICTLVGARQAADALSALQTLIERAPIGLHLTRPWKVVLAGSPNVGKSSLVNALVGYQRALVFDQPGTTRDVVTASCAMEGWPIELSDTAGLRTTPEPLEAVGIEMARRKLAEADCILLVLDLSQSFDEADRQLLTDWPQGLIVHNKCDLETGHSNARPSGLRTSALTSQGIDHLVAAIARKLVPNPPPAGAAVPFTIAQLDALRSAAEALCADDLRMARACLRGL